MRMVLPLAQTTRDKVRELLKNETISLLKPGNYKLGKHKKKQKHKTIWHFDLPSIYTCMYSDECIKECYACEKSFNHHANRYALNQEISEYDYFLEEILEEIVRNDIAILRLHVSGDFFSVYYCHVWLAIFLRCPNVKFYFYTRSWQDEEMRSVFEAMAALPNVHVWYSVDRSMPRPKLGHKRIRTAYLLARDEKEPGYKTNLIFRVNDKEPAKRINGSLVCPYEQGIKRKVKITCNKCKICFEKDKR